MKTVSLFLILVITFIGCGVPQEKYDRLKKENEELKKKVIGHEEAKKKKPYVDGSALLEAMRKKNADNGGKPYVEGEVLQDFFGKTNAKEKASKYSVKGESPFETVKRQLLEEEALQAKIKPIKRTEEKAISLLNDYFNFHNTDYTFRNASITRVNDNSFDISLEIALDEFRDNDDDNNWNSEVLRMVIYNNGTYDLNRKIAK